MIARIPNVLRWILLLPASLGAGFLVGGVIRLLPAGESGASIVVAYAAAFLSGLAYVWFALYVAHTVAPAHKPVVVTVLGILILGDLSFVHLILPELIQQAAVPPAAESDLALLLGVLRAGDYGGLSHAGLVKIGGVLTGCYMAWRKYVRGDMR